MAKTMNPSKSMTAGQIGRIQDFLGIGLKKVSISSELAQLVIETQADTLAKELAAVVYKHVEAVSNLIVRRVKVNRSRTPQEVLDATGRRQYVDKSVVNFIPCGEGEEVEVFFFNLNRYISNDDLEKEYELRGLKPADPYSLSAVNEIDSAFADNHSNCTHWKDKNGNWCYSAFDHWADGERSVDVGRGGSDWSDRWWFGGVRK